MPATQFFTMLHAARKLHRAKMSELCDVQAISICHFKYYEEMKEHYKEKVIEEVPIQTHKTRAIDYSKDEQSARTAMFAVFGNARKGLVM